VKGIVLAGGAGKRLHPSTQVLSKQLLPVYDKPMVYYPLSVLMLAGIQDILLISTPSDLPRFQELLGDGSRFGISLSYATQSAPRGIPEAFTIGASFIGTDRVALVLGDNVFYGQGFTGKLHEAVNTTQGATIFAYKVSDPERFGVVVLDANDRPVSIVEKPRTPVSPWAVTGLYFYDNDVIAMSRGLAKSARGELEITDINRLYLARGKLHVQQLGRGFAWLDTGTHESLLQASEFVRTIQHRQGLQIACLEEIAFNKGWLSQEQVTRQAITMGDCQYGVYLSELGGRTLSAPSEKIDLGVLPSRVAQ
jgi:glucose-1-phosphate thymidylyltransferase